MYACSSDAELQLNDVSAVQKDAELADAYTLIEELKGASKHLVAELAECKANRSLPSSSLDPAAPVATPTHHCQPRSTASVAFGDEVLQAEVAKVCCCGMS